MHKGTLDGIINKQQSGQDSETSPYEQESIHTDYGRMNKVWYGP